MTKQIVVYRVAPYIRHDSEPASTPEYVVEARVAKAGKSTILLVRPFDGLEKTRYEQKALGCVFFETPLQAIVDFAADQRLAIERANRARRTAERALLWAYSQGAPVPTDAEAAAMPQEKESA